MNELIGLISVRNYNYGSILQAFAFQKILFEKEINNEIIFYEKKNDIKQLLRIFNYPLLKAKLNTVKRGLYCKKDKEVGMVMSARNSSFSKFVDKELVFSKKYIPDWNQTKNNIPRASACLNHFLCTRLQCPNDYFDAQKLDFFLFLQQTYSICLVLYDVLKYD